MGDRFAGFAPIWQHLRGARIQRWPRDALNGAARGVEQVFVQEVLGGDDLVRQLHGPSD
jgi:hypothetical protein